MQLHAYKLRATYGARALPPTEPRLSRWLPGRKNTHAGGRWHVHGKGAPAESDCLLTGIMETDESFLRDTISRRVAAPRPMPRRDALPAGLGRLP
jgi:hypothetical protein